MWHPAPRSFNEQKFENIIGPILLALCFHVELVLIKQGRIHDFFGGGGTIILSWQTKNELTSNPPPPPQKKKKKKNDNNQKNKQIITLCRGNNHLQMYKKSPRQNKYIRIKIYLPGACAPFAASLPPIYQCKKSGNNGRYPRRSVLYMNSDPFSRLWIAFLW